LNWMLLFSVLNKPKPEKARASAMDFEDSLS
jgi:hypothetical protein